MLGIVRNVNTHQQALEPPSFGRAGFGGDQRNRRLHRHLRCITYKPIPGIQGRSSCVLKPLLRAPLAKTGYGLPSLRLGLGLKMLIDPRFIAITFDPCRPDGQLGPTTHDHLGLASA